MTIETGAFIPISFHLFKIIIISSFPSFNFFFKLFLKFLIDLNKYIL